MSNTKNWLEHSGVMGMKWGVRKDRKSGETHPTLGVTDLADRTGATHVGILGKEGVKPKFDKKSHQEHVEAVKEMAKSMRHPETGIFRKGGAWDQYHVDLAKKYDMNAPMNAKETKEYLDGLSKAGSQEAQRHAPEGSKALMYVTPQAAVLFVGSPKDIDDLAKKNGLKHSDMTDTSPAKIEFALKRDENGFVVGFEDEFQHSGVKGMKWGVHKAPETYDEVRAEKKTIQQMNRTVLPALNRKYQGQNLKNDQKVRDSYEKDAQRIFNKLYQDNVDMPESRVWSTVNTAAHLMAWGRVGITVVSAVAGVPLLHDDLNGRTPEGRAKLVLDELGQIVKIEDPEIEHGEFQHHGIKGMRWGVRNDRKTLRSAAAKRSEKTTTALKNEAPGGSSHKTTADGEPRQVVGAASGETSAQRYARIGADAKAGRAHELSEQDLKFYNARTEALAKVAKMNQVEPSWLAKTGKKVLLTTAEKTMQSVADQIASKYISGPILDQIKGAGALAGAAKAKADEASSKPKAPKVDFDFGSGKHKTTTPKPSGVGMSASAAAKAAKSKAKYAKSGDDKVYNITDVKPKKKN